MEPETSENIFQQIQNKGSLSESLSQSFITQERANAAIGKQTSLENAGNVNIGDNQFNLKASPYMRTADSQAFQQFVGAAGEAAPVAAAALLAATGVGVPASAYIAGATGGAGLASALAGFGTGVVAAHGVNQAYGALTGPGGLRGQQSYERLNSPNATTIGEIAPYLAIGKPWGEGSWKATNMIAGGAAGAINAISSQGVYNPQATPEENALEIAKQTGMGIAFGTMGPNKLGEAITTTGANIGLNNPLYRGAVKSTIFNGGEAPVFTDGAVNGVSFKESGGTATIYDPVSGTGRVLYRNADGTVTSVNYNNLEGQAAKNSGQSTFGLKDSGPGSPDFSISRFGTPPTKDQGPIDVQSTPVEPTGPIGRGRQLNEPQWGQQGDVGKPDGRGPLFGQDVQAPGPVSTETATSVQTPKTPASQSPASAVAPGVEAPTAPIPSEPAPVETAPVTPAETKPQIPEGHAPARPTPADFGIPENPSMEWHSKPENQKLWTKYSNAVNKWDMDYAMTHTADGRPLSQGSTEAPQTPQTPTTAESPAVAVSGVETPTAPIPKPTAASKPSNGTATATAERPSPGEIPGPAETGQTPATTGTGQTTEIPGQKPTESTQQTSNGEPVVTPFESVTLPTSTTAPIIPERKKDATREEILSGTRGIDEASYGIDQSFTNDERKQYFQNRAKYLLSSDPSKLNDKDIRERARIVGSAKPEVMSDDASYTGPKLPSFIEAGIASGKTLKDIYDNSGEIQKTEFTDWLQNYQIWMDSISHDNKSASEIATSATPESIANQNHAIADAGYRPVENDITKDINAGGQIVAISDWNNATYDKAKLNHDENVYLRHPQTKKVVSIRMPNGDLNHYTVSGPLFVNGLSRDSNGKVISDDAISMYEANVTGKPIPVGTPKILQFTPNAAKSVERILNSGSLLPRHTNKIPASTKPAQVARPTEVSKPVETKPTPTVVSKPEPAATKPETSEQVDVKELYTADGRKYTKTTYSNGHVHESYPDNEYTITGDKFKISVRYDNEGKQTVTSKWDTLDLGEKKEATNKRIYPKGTSLDAKKLAEDEIISLEKNLKSRINTDSDSIKRLREHLKNPEYSDRHNDIVRIIKEKQDTIDLLNEVVADLNGENKKTKQVETSKPEPAEQQKPESESTPEPTPEPKTLTKVTAIKSVVSEDVRKEATETDIVIMIGLRGLKTQAQVYNSILNGIANLEYQAEQNAGFERIEYIDRKVYIDGKKMGSINPKTGDFKPVDGKEPFEVKTKLEAFSFGYLHASNSLLKMLYEQSIATRLTDLSAKKKNFIIKFGDSKYVYTISANPVSVRMLYEQIRKLGKSFFADLVGMKVPEPEQQDSGPVETEKPKPPAEIPAPETTPVTETPVESKPAVKEINTAVGKVNDQIEKLIDLGNTKSAKNVFDTVLARLQEIEEDAVTDSGFRNVEYIKEGKIGNVYIDGQPLDVFFEKNNISEELQKKVREKITTYRFKATPSELKRTIELDVSNLLSKGKYTIKIPGDGTFKVAANPVAIRTLYKNIKSEGTGLWKGLSKYINKNNEQKEVAETEEEIDSKIAEAEEVESKSVPPVENVDEAWKENNKNQESQTPISVKPSEDAIPSAVKNGKKYKNALSISIKGKEIIIKGRGDYKPKVSEFDIEWQNLINAYASEDAAPIRNGAFPAFFDNSDLGGGWITAPLPMSNGNFLIYETNPRGKEAEGNAANRTVRLFRYVVNSSGNQLVQPFEISRNELKGFKTKDGSFAIPALVHAMIAAGADYAQNKSMSVSEVQEISGGRVTLTGVIDSQLKDYEDNSIAPPGIRGRMEEFNALPHGGSINNAIILFMADPTDNENAKNLLYELENNGNLSKESAKNFIREIISAQGGDQEIINFNIVRTPSDDTRYPIDFESKINKESAKIMLKWLMRGRKSLVTEVGTDDPSTGLPLPEQIQKPGNNPSTGKPWVKVKKGPDGKIELDDKGNPVTEPWMVPNPRRWLIKYGDYVNEETYHVKDSKGKTLFKPMPYQIRGINAALTRFLSDSTPVNLGQVGRAFLNMDAPGLGKTIQILGTAKAWHEKMKVWTKDPNSPWFGKPAKVLIVSQNRTILKNAFGGDAQKMGLDLGGKFEDVGGGNIKFIPNKTTGTDEGGLSIDGEESWIDFATYGDIKPQMELVPVFLDKDKKIPKMVPKYVVVDGEIVKGPDGQPMIEQESDGKGGTKDVMVQATQEIPNGPPKKGAGEWGLVVFDECHNMKNMDSGRSQAGHDLFIRSQHIMLATGTPIDKPHLLGYFIAMVLDVSLHDIAPELQMKVEGSKMSKTRQAKGFTAQDFRDSLSIEHWSKLPKDKQQEVFMLALLGIRKIRDRAGNLGRLIRRGKAFYGIADLWFDATDSMDPVAKEMIVKHEIEWAIKIESAPPGSKRNVIGQFLMESKRLAACIKLGVPETKFNPTTEPKGALRILLNEIKAGRKVIITVDTTNEAGKLDPDLKGKFKGLIGADGQPTSYDSEFTMLKSYLDKNGIKYGTIVGADVKDRQKSIASFQENNMDTPVIIMTVASGGTGLSLQDLFNINREWGYNPKTGVPKVYLGEGLSPIENGGMAKEEGRRFGGGGGFGSKEGVIPPLDTTITGTAALSYINKTASDNMPSYDKPLPTDSHPRSMIIVSAPWGGDAVEQVIGRADRMNTTTPTRVFWMTTEIASGDRRLIELVRAKIATLEAMIKYGDDLDALIAGGIEAEGVQSPSSAATMGQSRKLPLDAATTLAKTALQSALTGAKTTKENNEQKISDLLAEDPELSVPANKRSVSRWRSALKKANALIDSITVALKELDEGKLDPYSVDPRKIKDWLEARGLSPTGENEDGSDVEELDDGEDESMNNIYKNIINKNVITNSNGADMIVSAGKTKASRNRITNIIQHIYGLQSSITPTAANPVMNEKVMQIVNAIVRPYRSAYANGEINSRRFAAMLGFARDIAWRLQDYTINSIYASTPEEMHEKAEMQAAGAINIAAKELMTLLFKEDVAKRVYGKAHLNAKSSMYTTFHEVGHALMRLIPDDIKAEMFKELEAARTSWFESLPEGDVRKSLLMPEYDWHYTSGIRNIKFGKTTVTKYPLGSKYSKEKKTYNAITVSGNSKVYQLRGHDANFFISAMVSLALSKFAEHPQGLNDKSIAHRLKSVADIEISGVGREGQFGFKDGTSAVAPFLSLFNLGVGYNLGKLTNTSVPIVESYITKTSNPSDGLEKTTENSIITTGAIHNMIKDGNGFITVNPKNPNHAIITSILPGGKLTYITIDAKKFLTDMSDEFLNRIKGKSDSEKLSFLHDGNILREFIHGATGEDYLRQKQNINRTDSGTFENRIYRLTNIDEWLAENTAAYCRDYYMLGNFSEEVSMAGDIVSSLFVHASSGGDGRLTRRIISSILHNTIPYTDTATESGNDYYYKYGNNYNTPRNQSQQSGSLSPPNADINLNPLPKGMSVTEESLLKTGRSAAFSASSIRTVKKWASTIGEIRDWAIESAHNLVPSQKNIKKLYEGIRKRAGEAKSIASAPFTYGAEGLLGTLIGQIEQIGRLTNNDLVKELGKRIHNRPDTGELSRNTFTEDMTVYQNYWQAVFNEIIEKHLGEKIKNSSESRNRLLSFNKVFNKIGKSIIVKKEFSDNLARYILNVLHKDYNKLNRYLDEAREYLKEQKWSDLPSEIKDYLDEISTSKSPDAQIKLLESLIQQIELSVGEEAKKYGNGSKYDQISFGRESDSYLGDFFEEGTIDKILMDVGRCMAVSRNRPDYDAYVKSKFSKEVINAANELTSRWAAPYRAWAESMGEDISDWGTSWRPRVIDSDSINGIREGVRNKIDAFIQKAAETIYKDNKHQRVLLPSSFIEFFESQNYFLDAAAPSDVKNPTKTPVGIEQVLRMFMEWSSGPSGLKYEKTPLFLLERISKIKETSQNSEQKIVDEGSNFGFDVSIEPQNVSKAKYVDLTNFKTTKAIGIAVALKAYKKLLKDIFEGPSSTLGMNPKFAAAYIGELEMLDKAITRLEEQHNRKVIDSNLTKIEAYKLAKKFAERTLHKSLGIASSGDGYSDIFGEQFGDLNKADSLQQRLMECEFADDLLSEFYTNDVRIFGKHYNKEVTRTILIKHHIPEKFWNALRKSVVSNPESTHYWKDICWNVRRITESDQEESGSGIVNSMITLAAHSLYMTATSSLQFAEPLVFGATFKHKNPIQAAIRAAMGSAGNLRIVMTSIANTLASASIQLATLGNKDVENMPGLKKFTKEDEFYTRLARRIGIIQNKYLEGLDTSTADKRGLVQRMSDLALERFHNCGSGLTSVTNASRVAVMKSTIIALEQMADEIIMRTKAKNQNGEWIRGEELNILTPDELMQFRNLGIYENELSNFLQFCSTYRASISGDYSTMSPEMMDELIDKKTHMVPRIMKNTRRNPYDADRDNRIAKNYFNAIARINFMTVQVTSRATEQRARAAFQRLTSAGTARSIFFLSHYNSSLSRNVLVPAARTFNSAFKNKQKQFAASPGRHDPAMRKGTLPTGAYVSDISNPYAGFKNSYKAIISLTTVFAMMAAASYGIRNIRSQIRKNPAIYIIDEPTTALKIVASMDSAGFLGNASLPLNIVSSIRFNRSASQIAAGAYPGKVYGTIDDIRNAYGPGNRNSPNTPTAERKVASDIYDVIAIPFATTLLSYTLPQTNVGDMLFFTSIQSMAHPGVKEAFKQGWPGSGEAVPRTKSELDSLYREGKIGYTAYADALNRRIEWEAKNPKQKQAPGERDRR